MILGCPRAKQGLCHTDIGGAGGIILWALLTVFLVFFQINRRNLEIFTVKNDWSNISLYVIFIFFSTVGKSVIELSSHRYDEQPGLQRSMVCFLEFTGQWLLWVFPLFQMLTWPDTLVMNSTWEALPKELVSSLSISDSDSKDLELYPLSIGQIVSRLCQ